MSGVDAVITSAAGYTGHTEGDTAEIDILGNANLAEAAHRAGVRRFVLTSILTCDQTPQVPHFWHKKLAEDRLEELGVPFVALRPGAFLDQLANMGGDQFAQRSLAWFGPTDVPLTFVLTSDLAGYLADAVDADGVDGQRIDIGWDRPVSIDDLAASPATAVNEPFAVHSIPLPPASDAEAAGRVRRRRSQRHGRDDVLHLDRRLRRRHRHGRPRCSGRPDRPEDAVTRLLGQLGHLPA